MEIQSGRQKILYWETNTMHFGRSESIVKSLLVRRTHLQSKAIRRTRQETKKQYASGQRLQDSRPDDVCAFFCNWPDESSSAYAMAER